MIQLRALRFPLLTRILDDGFTTVLTREREGSADRSRVYRSFRENSVSSSSHFRDCAGKPAAVFSHRRKSSQETLSDRGRRFLRTSTSSRKRRNLIQVLKKLQRVVLEGQRDHLLAEAETEILKQEWEIELLNTSILEFQRQAHSNRLEMDCVNHWYEESRREQARLHEELAQREKALRETRIRSIHDVEDVKRAQEMRIDEFSRNELRESHATTQELTSRIQELQEEWNNYMGDSREFQDVQSICSGKLSHVPSQPAVVPRFCGMLSRDQCLRSDTWNLLGTLGNVFGSPRAVIGSSSTPCQGMFHSWNQSATGGNPVRERTGKLAARSEERNRETIATPRFARKPINHELILSFQQKLRNPQNYVIDQQRLQISEFHFDKFFSAFVFGTKRFKTWVEVLFRFSPWKPCYGSKKWRWSIQWMNLNSRDQLRVWISSIQWMNLNPRDQLRVRISRISRCWMRGLRLLWTRSSRSPTSRKRSVWRNRKPRKKIGFLRGKTDRLHDLRLLSSDWRSWYRSWLRWSIHNYSSQWWCSGIQHEMEWNSIIDDQDPTWWRSGKFVQLENMWALSTQHRIKNCMTWKSNRKISMPDCQKLKKDGEEKHRSETQIAKLWRQKWENWNRELWLRIAGVKRGGERGQGECYQWKVKGQCSRGDKCSFRHGEDKRAKPTPKTAPLSEPPTQRGRSAPRKKEPQRLESIWEVRSTAVQRLPEMCCLHQITLWLLACFRMSILLIWIGLQIRW